MSEITKYRTKPVEIEAIQLNWENWNRIVTFVSQEYFGNSTYLDEEGRPTELVTDKVGLFLNTLEGQMLARHGDWIIKGTEGEFYACKQEVFEKKYAEAKLKPRPSICDNCTCGKAAGCKS